LFPQSHRRTPSNPASKLHLETQHPEGDTASPFTIQEDQASIAAALALSIHTPPSTASEEDENYVSCPVEGCGEALLLTELESHIEMHAEEQDSSNDEEDDDDERGRGKRIKLNPEIGAGAGFDTKLSYALRNLEDVDEHVNESGKGERDGKQASAKAAWKGLLKMPDVVAGKATTVSPSKGRRRLGVSALLSFFISRDTYSSTEI
jgi:zinc finger-containing ubiquitin peptidase 1